MFRMVEQHRRDRLIGGADVIGVPHRTQREGQRRVGHREAHPRPGKAHRL